MAQRVTAIFAIRSDAERAADALVNLGADRSQISMVSRHEEGLQDAAPQAAKPHSEHIIEPAREVGDAGAPLTTADEADAAKGAEVGAVIGAVAGIAAGAAMLIVPGFGPVLAAGPLSWAIGGAIGATVAGAVAGGVYGSLRDLGIPEQHARAYEERIRGGGVLMTALVPGLAESRIRDILSEHHAEDVTLVDDTSMPAETSARDSDYTAPAAMSETIVESTTVVGAYPNIAPGQTKPMEGEWRDRAAEQVAKPADDRTVEGQKPADMMEEEHEHEEEPVNQRA
jgi:hypothetical protein